MRPNRHQRPLARQIRVQLVLQINEGSVGEGVERHVAEDGRGEVRADGGRLFVRVCEMVTPARSVSLGKKPHALAAPKGTNSRKRRP